MISMMALGITHARWVPVGKPIVQPAAKYTYRQLCEDLEALAARYPDTLRVASLGGTREGRELFVAVAGAPGACRHVLIQGGLHAREHMTSLLTMMQLERLLRHGVPEGFNFHILPMTNPDGVEISQTGTGSALVGEIYRADVAAGFSSPVKRKALMHWKANAAGVDLNRNFDAEWQRVDTRPAPSGENYRGSAPESEPETRALVEYTKRHPFAATISYHAAGEVMYYSFLNNSPANEQGLMLAKAINRHARYRLVGDQGNSFGGYKDWAIQKRGIPSLTVEVGKGEPPLALAEYDKIWKDNREVPFAVAKWVKSGL